MAILENFNKALKEQPLVKSACLGLAVTGSFFSLSSNTGYAQENGSHGAPQVSQKERDDRIAASRAFIEKIRQEQKNTREGSETGSTTKPATEIVSETAVVTTTDVTTTERLLKPPIPQEVVADTQPALPRRVTPQQGNGLPNLALSDQERDQELYEKVRLLMPSKQGTSSRGGRGSVVSRAAVNGSTSRSFKEEQMLLREERKHELALERLKFERYKFDQQNAFKEKELLSRAQEKRFQQEARARQEASRAREAAQRRAEQRAREEVQRRDRIQRENQQRYDRLVRESQRNVNLGSGFVPNTPIRGCQNPISNFGRGNVPFSGGLPFQNINRNQVRNYRDNLREIEATVIQGRNTFNSFQRFFRR